MSHKLVKYAQKRHFGPSCVPQKSIKQSIIRRLKI